MRTRHLAVIGLVIVLAAAAAPAGAQSAFERDRVFSNDPLDLDWSPGEWSNVGGPLPDCTTFPGGVTTNPGQPTAADSLYCAEIPSAWEWSVTVPGPQTIEWGVTNFPPEYEVCAQIFYGGTRGDLTVDVNIGLDWMRIADSDGTILYEGSFSGFYSGPREEFVFMEARRCAIYRVLQNGACCLPDGTCLVISEEQCAAEQGLWYGEIPCEPNPCEPVPVQETNWGRIKAIYR
ncbi:MAG: hypothetical protein QUU85_01525 [Candidatus Eisenbacteria bacterium]|nr:hypothetical protein [Candidatus Eisenbacteria bacterium]